MVVKSEVTKEKPLDIETIFDQLSPDGKRLFLGMCHFSPEIGGNKEAVLATCAIDEKTFEKAAEELRKAGLLVQGSLKEVYPPLEIEKGITKKEAERLLQAWIKKYRERGLMTAEEADNISSNFTQWFKRLEPESKIMGGAYSW